MVTAAGTTTFFHTDKMGSVIAMSDMSGHLAEGPFVYDPYGNCLASGANCSAGEPFRYTGQRLDAENTSFYYDRARIYYAGLGRFLQTDPVGYKDDLNDYMYVHNDPTDGVDPTGMVDDVTGGNWANMKQENDPETRRAELTTGIVGAPLIAGVGVAVVAGPTTVVGTIAISAGVGGSLAGGHSAANGNSPARVAADTAKGTFTSGVTAAGGRFGGLAVKGGVVPGEMAAAYAGTKAVGGSDTEAKVNAAVSGFVGALALPFGTATSSEAAAITSQVLKSFIKGEVKTDIKSNLPKPSVCPKNECP